MLDKQITVSIVNCMDVAVLTFSDVAGSVFAPLILHDLKQDQKQQTTEQPFQ